VNWVLWIKTVVFRLIHFNTLMLYYLTLRDGKHKVQHQHKVVPVHTMKTYGDVSVFHLFLTLVPDVTAESFMLLLFSPSEKDPSTN
jgi:hypothetical protein